MQTIATGFLMNNRNIYKVLTQQVFNDVFFLVYTSDKKARPTRISSRIIPLLIDKFDIPLMVHKEDTDIFQRPLFARHNEWRTSGKFPPVLCIQAFRAWLHPGEEVLKRSSTLGVCGMCVRISNLKSQLL